MEEAKSSEEYLHPGTTLISLFNLFCMLGNPLLIFFLKKILS